MAGDLKGNRVVVLDWVPDKNSKAPMYRQIIDYISTKISSGDWTIGSILPSQRTLAEKFGIIKGEIGKGMQVISNTWSLLISSVSSYYDQYLEEMRRALK